MIIPKRLEKIVSLLDSDKDFVADVGADHGLLVIDMAHRGFKNIVAIENKKGPYIRLVNNLNVNKVDNVTTLLSSGIHDIPAFTNTIVIAGMGGELILDILLADLNKLKNIHKLILLPHNNTYYLRENLKRTGFAIVDEEIVKEEDKFYEIIVLKRGESVLNDMQTVFGPFNLVKKQVEFYEKWSFNKEKFEKVLANNNLPLRRQTEIKEEIRKIERALNND